MPLAHFHCEHQSKNLQLATFSVLVDLEFLDKNKLKVKQYKKI